MFKKYGVINGGVSIQAKEKSKKTCLEKYGVEYSFQSQNNKEKSKETLLRRYNCENIQQRKISLDECTKIKENEVKKNLQKSIINHDVEQANRIKEENQNKYIDIWNDLKHRKTCLEKYGVECALQAEEIKEKSKKTCLEKYGVDYYTKTEEYKEKVKQTCLEKYGVDSPLKSLEILNKVLNTKKKNHTFNTSKPEEELYLYIKEKFPSVIRQYKDKERYPWCCDFYILELDLFIELNGTWTHGKHPFNINSKEDISILNMLKDKYENSKHPFYLYAIKTWTKYDVNKRNKAKEENLNFHEFWNIEEAKQFIDKL